MFFKSREPFVPAQPPPPAVPVAPPVVVDPGLLVGGVMINNGLSRAYLLGNAGQVGVWVGEGDMLQGWTVKSIDKAGVKIEQGGRTIDLQLYPTN
ncbi:hypothetical protein JQ634_02500 [Bradyrhizobium sp. AUGA SZCCT0240]|uniref:hypothetical protein n=1 Tax=Bradyrhizobium sp. AUGA SZCCT0240 TaxID=2807669 RepID=UPI001BACC328|nr:hypothetical protein [Bradyrhizobium sp. AUGA SZCCT0240]MBR1252567.1 hypothetical protein [Bradyrhizobium sp. AUGA SZCCT0240]